MSTSIRMTSENSLVEVVSAKLGNRHGFELYRYLFGLFLGVGPEQGQRPLAEVTQARRCGSELARRDVLIDMDQKCRELARYPPFPVSLRPLFLKAMASIFMVTVKTENRALRFSGHTLQNMLIQQTDLNNHEIAALNREARN